ncbi:MAG: TetR/AcrR family transcriptional regulator [Sphingomonas sp.]|nr:MAG: TetR/AcrR family transcriptional regulator [Sphingomonas sp.]
MTLLPDQTIMNPRKSARQARSAATIEVIVEAAARILETAGLAGYTTNAIAERAGVSVGSLYQYFPNKDAITRALIRRELEMLEAAVMAIDVAQSASAPLSSLIAIAVDQQMQRPVLAQLLEVEEDRLCADSDVAPVRARIGDALSAILGLTLHPDRRGIVQDVMSLIATLVNAAAGRGERDAARLIARIQAVVQARLRSA